MGGGLPEFDDDRNLREKPAPTDQNTRPRREDERTSGDDIFSPDTGGRISEHANELNISNPYFRDGGHDNKSSPLPDRESATFRSYQLMEITSDRQDLSFVDKVLVLEDQISALSNDLVPESAQLKVGRLTKLDFDLLDTTSFSAVGFYGDKEMMIKIFSNENLLSTEFLDRMHADSLKPGLYACLKSNHVYLFYWNGSKQMTDASRKDVSCNFVRYLVELCGSVYACVQGESIQKSLKNSTSSFPRQHRTQRLQISLRQESEDDIKLSDGFKVALPRTCFGASFDSSEGLQLSQGLHRFAVLSCCVNPRKVVSKTVFETGGPAHISSFLSSHSYSVRYTDLPDEEFLQLLNVLHREELLEAYKKEQAGWNQRSHEAESKLHKINLLKKSRETQILEAFDRALPSYLTQKRQWEESLVPRCTLNSTSPSNTDASGKNVRLQNSTTDGLVKGKDISGGSASLSSDHDRRALGDLEIELCHIWTGAKDTDHRLLFSGAEFELFSASGGASLGNFIIEGMDDAGAVPICFGKEAVIREKDKTKGAKERIKLLRGDTNGFAKGPVVTSVETELLVEIQGIKSTEKFSFLPGPVRIRPLDSSNCCMTRWLDALSGKKLPRMRKFATFLSFLVEKKGDKLAKNEKLLRKLLTAESARSLRELLPKEMHPLMDDFWKEPQNPSVVPRIHSMVADLSAQLYSEAREGFLTAIRSFVKKEILPLLQEKFEMDASKEVKAITDVISREKKDYMSAMKEQMSDTSTRVDEKKLLTLKGVNFTDANSSWRKFPLIGSWLTSSTKVNLTYVKEGLEAETITWKAIEMVPSKRDVDEVMSAQSGRALVPSFTAEAVELITLEPSLERLDRVLLLKSGQVLIFVLAKNGSYLHLYVCPRLGVSMTGRNPSKVWRRGLDLVAVDEASRFMAMYNRNSSTIQAFRFDESFQRSDWTGIDIQLSDFSGNNNIVWMQFVPGKRELLVADDDHRIRVFELALAMMKPRHISLPFPFTKACITPDANCLIVFTTGSPVPVPEETHDDNGFVVLQQQQDSEEYPDSIDIPASHESHREDRLSLSLHIYQLGDSLALLKVLQLDSIFVANFLTDLHVDCKYIGPQMHLVIHSATDPDNVVSKLLEISSAAQTYQLQKVGRNRQLPATIDERKNASNNSAQSSCPALDYLFHIFDKYATSPPLCSSQKSVDFHVLLNPPKKAGVNWDRVATENRCVEHMKSSLQKLMEKGKDFSKLELEVYAESLTDDWNLDTSLRLSQCTRGGVPSCMGRWIKQLVCLVPLQIARAENNTLKPLVNGLQIPSNAAYADAVSLANLIRFGLYDLVLASWGGEVRVISSMGKQSSGKSYLLNHLAGSLLDVAGGRCTDGVWMTMRSEADCLYVVLDFEGLGSFERSEQEDMLLSILNAAVSNVSIFNKKDFHLDKETEAIFQRFQDGVSLVKADEKLFRGLFYIAIKDVDASDVEDLKTEFIAKIRHICSKSNENFLTTMYGGEVEIAAMPPFQRPEFHESIVDIGEMIQELTSSYHSGRSFMLDLKLVIAQISARDWSPVDSKRLAMRLNLLRRHLVCAIRLGECLERGNLLDFDTEEEINEDPIQVEGFVFTVKDAGLELARDETDAGKMMGSVLRSLREEFEEVVKRKGSDEKWHSLYEAFLMCLIDRRRDRVLTWLQANTRDFPGDGDVGKLELEALAMLSEIKHRLALCSCKCGECFLRCTLERGHPSDHSCLGNHACAELCTYCLEESEEQHIVHGAELECNDLAGHHGAHDCKRRPHTCSKPCIFFGKSSNCNRICSLRADHEGEHRCNSRQHMCDKSCSLPGCYNSCAVPFELGDHQQHACHEKFCPTQCSMDGCTRTCVTHNHFHALQQDVVHFCANEHPCQMPCEAPGICHVLTEIVKQTRSFHGKRGDFEYEYVSEQSEIRKSCCLLIPPSQQRHTGPHVHTTNSNAVHFCEVRCPACDYYCQLPIGHPGLHKTVHGNMRKMKFVSEVEEIDLLDRKYARGESGMAELCMMHCKARGRGHTHLIQCPGSEKGGCCTEKLYDGARHATIQCKGLEVDVPMDEMTHETYWKNVRFVDPCEEGERAVFGLCDHFCRSEEHIVEGGGGSATTNCGGVAGRSYCTEKLWHAPVSRSGAFQGGGGGYVTEDGHHFACDHSRNTPHNVIFVIDKSGSMDSRDISPSMAKLVASGQANRLGCVMEAMMRFIKMRLQATSGSSQGADSVSVVLFDNSAVTAARLEEMKEEVVETIMNYRADGGTTYSSGLQAAEQVLRESRNAAEVQKKCPVVIFLSDGGNNGGVDPVYLVGRMKQEEPRLAVHTIMFGSDPSFRILQDMAAAGDGTFQLSLDEVQLAKSFEGLARSLKPKLAALCSST